jgi:ferredoxin-type protein NapG
MAAPQKNRRDFLLKLTASACSVGLLGLGLVLHSRAVLPAQAIRPPGALDEDKFLGACIRCGLCVRDCPFGILKLAELGETVALGTPYFNARTGSCEMCDHIPCVPICPTGALDHALTEIKNARMGLAVLIDQESCIAFHGLRCEVCFNVCPIRGEAITLESRHNERSGKHALFIPVVHSDACTGCGKCEQACILEEAAIKVFPHTLAKGQLGAHYRLGWQEKEKAGEALVTPDMPHEYNLPEGMGYEHDGRGLFKQETPFEADPLETLRRGQENLGQ